MVSLVSLQRLVKRILACLIVNPYSEQSVFNTLSKVGRLPYPRALFFRCVRMCSRVVVFNNSFDVAHLLELLDEAFYIVFPHEVGCLEDSPCVVFG